MYPLYINSNLIETKIDIQTVGNAFKWNFGGDTYCNGTGWATLTNVNALINNKNECLIHVAYNDNIISMIIPVLFLKQTNCYYHIGNPKCYAKILYSPNVNNGTLQVAECFLDGMDVTTNTNTYVAIRSR